MFSREFIESFLQGYTSEELGRIEQDLIHVNQLSFYQVSPSSTTPSLYVATADGPGSAKSTTIETFLRENDLTKHFVYADPDAVSLKNMSYTYRASLSYFHFALSPSNHDALKDAYNKWRGASNYINHEILQKAFGGEKGLDEKYCVAHGTTSTYSKIASLYEKIKARGYHIKLLLCYSHDETRKQRIESRETEQGFVQSDLGDVIEKEKMFPERFDDYFKYADELVFYWNDELRHRELPVPCAKYMKAGDKIDLTILDEKNWLCFCRKYLKDVEAFHIPISKDFESIIPKELLVDKGSNRASALNEYALWSNTSAPSVSTQQNRMSI